MNKLDVYIKRLHQGAIIPTYAKEGDNCCDLYSVEDVVVPSGGRRLIGTGLSIQMTPGFGAHIQARSGNAWKKGLAVLNAPGQIDNHYRGEIKVILYNADDKKHTIFKGDRIAQMSFHPIYSAEFIEVATLTNTDRADNGFGSTGLTGSKI